MYKNKNAQVLKYNFPTISRHLMHNLQEKVFLLVSLTSAPWKLFDIFLYKMLFF
jgi:hypothetical protein